MNATPHSFQSWRSKIGLLIFSGLFMLGFGGFGAFASVELWKLADGYFRTDRMVQIEGQIKPMPASKTDINTLAVRYVLDGQTYWTQRYSFSRAFGEQAREQLAKRLGEGKDVKLWVDPQSPSVAVLKKEVAAKELLFLLPFSILFSLVGFGAGYFFVKTLFTPVGIAETPESTPVNPQSLAPESSPIATIVGAVLLAIFSAPFFAAGFLDKAPIAFGLVSILLLGTSLWMLYAGIRNALTHRASVAPRLTFEPAQPRVGQSLRVRITFPSGVAEQTLSLTILRHDTDSRGSTSTQSTHEIETCIANRVGVQKAGSAFEGVVRIPHDQSHSASVPGGVSHTWSLNIEKAKGIAAYRFPFVLGAADASVSRATDTVIPFAHSTSHAEIPAEVVSISARGRERTFLFPASGFHAGPISLLCIAAGLLFAAVRQRLSEGALEAFELSAWVVLFASAVLAILGALHYARRTTRVIIHPSGLTVSRASPLRTKETHIPLAHLKGFEENLQMKHQTGTRTAVQIQALRTRGEAVAVTPYVEGMGVRRALLQSFNEAFGAVREFGITPPPSTPATPLFNATYRSVYITVVVFVTCLAAAALWIGPDRFREQFQRENLVNVDPHVPSAAATCAYTESRVIAMAGINDADFAQAVALCPIEVLQAWLAKGANANAVRADGRSALMLAAQAGDLAKVNLLLERGANVALKVAAPHPRVGANALGDAISGQRIAVARRLIDAGADVGDDVCCGWTLMHVAAESGCLECFEFLRERNVPLDAFAKASRGETPLMLAARYGRLEAMRWLLKRGADPNKRDPHGYNTAGWAAFFKRDNALALLKEWGADTDTSAKLP